MINTTEPIDIPFSIYSWMKHPRPSPSTGSSNTSTPLSETHQTPNLDTRTIFPISPEEQPPARTE